ncbi:Eukaryotic translation initiation factor 3 subunit K [Olea europaea subsp. europaea]|uniref:Eukaryotic translation initiation factor 3 subunit K n=1 Tax=Olea europaea subsp. europaea TaxID=158383 RepID=A0A8S0R3P8_OLEEU|nr:Eukaryotic translation initiation factor 3 subunit K [Olea europaea subsp. europaea]
MANSTPNQKQQPVTMSYTVEQLVIINPYNPNILLDLGNYVNEQFKALIVLSHYLETARFSQFWNEAAKSRHMLDAVPGFEQEIQAYAIHVLSLTYQRIRDFENCSCRAINIEGLSLDKFIDHHVSNSDWAIENSQD